MKFKTLDYPLPAVSGGFLILIALSCAFVFRPAFAEADAIVPTDTNASAEVTADVTTAPDATAAEEGTVPADVPAAKQELMQQAADGDVAQPRVRKFMKPNRSLLHESVNNQKSGYGFLEENQRKPGVVKLKSGLQYKILKAGNGAKANESDVVKCQYKGALIDGTVFEQSTAAGSNVKVAPLIPGLKEAVKLMPIGSKWQVYIPPEMGFGSAGKPPKVGPDAVLVYDIEVLGISSVTNEKR